MHPGHPPDWVTVLAGGHAIGLDVGQPYGWVIRMQFTPWSGPPLGMAEDCNKRRGRVIGRDGDLSCAEVETVRRLRGGGWDAGWFNTFGCGRRRWGEYMVSESAFPHAAREIVRAVRASLGARGGVPDVVVWSRQEVGFVECKGPGDRLERQQAW